ncbi:tol-pal system protein YbgF [Aliiglaciecola lipolytica]|uniref:Cell division coordinator CpoB n=1 Tax=Aliiglaciecola lipolytica E3 TaxID=1127673 RepID=K6YFC0_9ALTE|nr:tol-pal system protein YbgF [Aliiglaciecola lipolytica]GAC15303.1 TPR domain-containing protein [Aliiglaciecola lipolytica E3]
MIKRNTAISLLLVYGAAVNAAPAPVTDLNDSSLTKRVEVIERILDSRTEMQHRIQQQLDDMQNEVSEMRGTLELHNHQLEKILERQRELYLEIDKRIAAVSSQTNQQTTSPNANQNGAADSSQIEMPVVTNASESDAYDRAVNLILRDKQYDLAIPEFQAFINTYPNSTYAPNAHYWLGQLLFNKQQWEKAAEQFQILVSGYPDSSKRADALFKLGVVEQRRDNLARARQLFEQVLSEYPDSASSRLADSRLKAMN